jgi:hypothetical protein
MAFSHGLGTLFAMTAAGLLLDRSSTTTVFLSSAVFSTLALVVALVFLLPALRRSKTLGADETRS